MFLQELEPTLVLAGVVFAILAGIISAIRAWVVHRGAMEHRVPELPEPYTSEREEDAEMDESIKAVFAVVFCGTLLFAWINGNLIEMIIVWLLVLYAPELVGRLITAIFEEDNYRRWIKRFAKISTACFIIPLCNTMF